MKISQSSKVPSVILGAALLAGLGFVTHATAQTSTYLIDLNSKTATELDNRIASVSAMNDAGQAVGHFFPGEFPAQPGHAFITGPDGTGMRDLGTFAASGGPSYWSYAQDINNAGQVTGFANPIDIRDQAFITGPNGVGMRAVGMLGDGSAGYGINDAGQVVGHFALHAFITGPDGMGMRDLGTLGGSRSYAVSINEAGQVVGHSHTANGPEHAFITGPDGTGMRDLGTLGGSRSYAVSINEAGQVVGHSHTANGPEHAFITGPDGTGMRDLGTLSGGWSYARDISDAGQVVGESKARAFITGPSGEGMIDLNSLIDLPGELVLTNAIAINNQNQVLATAGIIPEPETYALMLAGLGLIGFMARRESLRA